MAKLKKSGYLLQSMIRTSTHPEPTEGTIDRIKMDMQFVHGIERNEKDQAIANIIISLAKHEPKGYRRGVETGHQRDFLSSGGVMRYRVYFYKLMPVKKWTRF